MLFWSVPAAYISLGHVPDDGARSREDASQSIAGFGRFDFREKAKSKGFFLILFFQSAGLGAGKESPSLFGLERQAREESGGVFQFWKL